MTDILMHTIRELLCEIDRNGYLRGQQNFHGVKLSVRRYELDGEGYDLRGQYWGSGTPLWFIEYHDGGSNWASCMVRAKDKQTAKAICKGAKFTR